MIARKPKLTPDEERFELQLLLKQRSELAAYAAGQGPFVLALSQEQVKRLTTLIRKYRFEDEFRDSI